MTTNLERNFTMSNAPIDKDAVIEYLFSALEYQILGQYDAPSDSIGVEAWAKLDPVSQAYVELRHNQMYDEYEKRTGNLIGSRVFVELP
jgi:hypothetical protein